MPEPASNMDGNVTLTSKMVHEGLHTLGRHPLKLGYCYLGLDLRNRGVKHFDVLEKYENLMYVNISGNSIESLNAFQKFCALVHLDASDNELEECLDFSPLKCTSKNAWSSGQQAVGSLLTLAILSSNRIKTLRDLSHHPFLECLLLSKNLISNINGLDSLKYLKVLDLSDNTISRISGLSGLSISELKLDGNLLEDLNGLEDLPHLSVLSVARNQITSLRPLKGCRQLTRLNVQGNRLTVLRQCEYLKELTWLQVLEMQANPCCSKPHYRGRIIFRLPQLRQLDLTVISGEEKIRSNNLYNSERGDVHIRQEVFVTAFPNREFVDVGAQLQDDEVDFDVCL